MKDDIIIRGATASDDDEIWRIIRAVITTAGTYFFAPDSSREKMLSYWCGTDYHTYVAILRHKIAGTFIIRDNAPDLGAHVANASYMTLPSESGKGIGRKMAEYSLQEAKRLGYDAMQFNRVIKSNERAVLLWQKLGFEIKGEIPGAFKHPVNGFTNIYIMWRKL